MNNLAADLTNFVFLLSPELTFSASLFVIFVNIPLIVPLKLFSPYFTSFSFSPLILGFNFTSALPSSLEVLFPQPSLDPP